MFNLFRKKTEAEKLEDKYKKLLAEAHKLSTTNRKLSDTKIYEANQILEKLEKLTDEKK